MLYQIQQVDLLTFNIRVLNFLLPPSAPPPSALPKHAKTLSTQWRGDNSSRAP